MRLKPSWVVCGWMGMSLAAFAADAPKAVEVPATSASTVDYVGGVYALDFAKSSATLMIPPSRIEAKFSHVQGNLYFANPMSESKADLQIAVTSMNSGSRQRDQDIQSPKVLDAAKFPNIRFVSKSFSGTPNDFKVNGELTIRDVTKQITLSGRYVGHRREPGPRDLMTAEFNGAFSRKEFGINYASPGGGEIGDQVLLKIRAVGILKDAKNAPASQ